MPDVSKEPLITIKEAVNNFESQYLMEDDALDYGTWSVLSGRRMHHYSMWPVLKLCVRHSWLQDVSGDAETDQKIYFLLNYVVLSRVFNVASSPWSFGSCSNLWTPESDKLLLHESDLMTHINDWTGPENEDAVSGQETICPVRVEES